MLYKALFLFCLLSIEIGMDPSKGIYHKEYDESGTLKSEGWMKNGLKSGYWKFYHPNGNISMQGHYKSNVREKYWYFYNQSNTKIKEGRFRKGKKYKWWLFYDSHGRIDHKCQLSGGRKNGYCLKYKNEELVSAQKYKNGKKIKEWFSFVDFQRENKLSDLK